MMRPIETSIETLLEMDRLGAHDDYFLLQLYNILITAL